MKSTSKPKKEGSVGKPKSGLKPKAANTPLKMLLEKEIEAHALTSKKLQTIENQFRALMANSLDAMALFDKDFNVLYRSPAAFRISGWTDEDLAKNPFSNNTHPEDKVRVSESLKEALQSKDKSVYVSFRSKHKAGHYFWVEGTFRNMLEDPVHAIVLSIRDITSRKLAEQDAANSESNLNTIFDNMSEGVVMMDKAGTIQLFNKNAVRFAYTGTGKALTIGDNIKNYIDSPRKEFFDHIEHIIRSGKNFDYDREVTAGNTKHWINVAINPVFKDDELKGICMVTRDITSRKEAELKIAEREEQFRTLIERISDAFISFDKDLRYTYMNQKAGEITHQDPKTIIGKYVWDVFPEAIGSSTYETFNKAMSEQVYLCNTDYFEPLNLWQENHLYPSENGLSVFIRDISERKRAEKKLTESEQRFRTLIENSSDAIVLADENIKVIYQSPSAERITGISLAYRQANPNTSFSHPDDRQIIAEAIERSKRSPGEPILFQSRLHHIEGKYIWIEGVISNQLDNPDIKAMVFNYRDVSERKNAEAEILKLNDELEEKVVQRTEQLEALNNELESFTYSVSHDLRAPLRIIDGFSQIVMDDYGDKLDDSGKKNLTIIVKNAKRMGMLIDDLLNFSKVGKAQIRISEVNMNSLVSEVIEELSMSNVQIPAHVKIEELKSVKGDQALLKQVWINLISNAIKYSGKKESPEISIGSYAENNRLIYFVKDNGAGFDMKYAHKLFGVFQRLHKLEEFTGTGVGLALVQRIIIRHEGTVWAEGKVNEGATFYFALPG